MVQEVKLILAVPAALLNDLSSEMSGERSRPELDGKTIEGASVEQELSGY